MVERIAPTKWRGSSVAVLLVAAVVAQASCGGASEHAANAPAPPLAVSGGGTVGVQQISFVDGYFAFQTDGPVVALRVALTEWADSCRDHKIDRAPATVLELGLQEHPPMNPPPGQVAALFRPGTYNVNGAYYSAQLYAGSYCVRDAELSAIAGTIDLTYVSQTQVAGSLDIAFNGGRLSGNFSVAACGTAACN